MHWASGQAGLRMKKRPPWGGRSHGGHRGPREETSESVLQGLLVLFLFFFGFGLQQGRLEGVDVEIQLGTAALFLELVYGPTDPHARAYLVAFEILEAPISA